MLHKMASVRVRICATAAVAQNQHQSEETDQCLTTRKTMDEIVLKSMAKWPNVPDVFGWVELDRRGNWSIKNQRVSNPAISEFIGRNYQADERGRWFFQNGPQRVFVSLAYAPFVCSTHPTGASTRLVTHTGSILEQITGAWLDEDGTVILRWPGGGVGTLCDRDLAEVAAWFTDAAGRPLGDETVTKAFGSRAAHGTSGIWLGYGGKRVPVGRVIADKVPTKFGFDRCPRPEPGEPDC